MLSIEPRASLRLGKYCAAEVYSPVVFLLFILNGGLTKFHRPALNLWSSCVASLNLLTFPPLSSEKPGQRACVSGSASPVLSYLTCELFSVAALGHDPSVSPGTTAYCDRSSLRSVMPACLVTAPGGSEAAPTSACCLTSGSLGSDSLSLPPRFQGQPAPRLLRPADFNQACWESKKACLAGPCQANYYLGASC